MESMVSPCCTVIAVPPCQFQPGLADAGAALAEPVTSGLGLGLAW
jgi:hypothetical protein